MFWMPWRITQKRISTTTSLAKYDFRKSVGRGACPPYPPSFVGEPVTSLSDHEFLNYLCPTEHILKSEGSFTSQNTPIWKSKDSINSSQITDRQSTTWYLPFVKFFKKTKRGLELVSQPHFLHNFWRKLFLLLYAITWPNFIAWLPLLREILGNMFNVVIACWPGSNVINFEINLSF